MADLMTLTDSEIVAQSAGTLKKGTVEVELTNGQLLIKAHNTTVLSVNVPNGKKWTAWFGVTIKELPS